MGPTTFFVTKISADGTTIVYSTYLGGSSVDNGHGIAVDGAGNAYITGLTGSVNFPTVNPIQSNLAGGFDGFVTKLNADGDTLVYSTYLGGSHTNEEGFAIAVGSDGTAHVSGETGSSNFPTFNAMRASSCGGGRDGFVTKLSTDGSAFIYSTYLCDSGFDRSFTIAVDAGGNAYVGGEASSAGFPTSAGAFQTTYGGGSADGYVTKLSPAGGLVYSTLLGGSGADVGLQIAVDMLGNVYVAGPTDSPDFPTTPGSFQSTHGGGTYDAAVTKLNATGSALVYSTYLGGSGDDITNEIKVDNSGSVYTGGSTSSTDFPMANPLQASSGGGGDAFVSKLNVDGSDVVFSTYFGGTGTDTATGLAVDSSGNIYIGGRTASTNFPTMNPFQPTLGGSTDAFIAKIDAIDTVTPIAFFQMGEGDTGAMLGNNVIVTADSVGSNDLLASGPNVFYSPGIAPGSSLSILSENYIIESNTSYNLTDNFGVEAFFKIGTVAGQGTIYLLMEQVLLMDGVLQTLWLIIRLA